MCPCIPRSNWKFPLGASKCSDQGADISRSKDTQKKRRERPADSADSTREEKACSPGISSAISQKEEPCISTPQDTETLDLRERDNGVESEKRTPFYFFRSQKLCMKSHGEKKQNTREFRNLSFL
jgi:hypothetical protein